MLDTHRSQLSACIFPWAGLPQSRHSPACRRDGRACGRWAGRRCASTRSGPRSRRRRRSTRVATPAGSQQILASCAAWWCPPTGCHLHNISSSKVSACESIIQAQMGFSGDMWLKLTAGVFELPFLVGLPRDIISGQRNNTVHLTSIVIFYQCQRKCICKYRLNTTVDIAAVKSSTRLALL